MVLMTEGKEERVCEMIHANMPCCGFVYTLYLFVVLTAQFTICYIHTSAERSNRILRLFVRNGDIQMFSSQ